MPVPQLHHPSAGLVTRAISDIVGVPRMDEEHIRLAELLQAATLAAHDHVHPQMLRESLSQIFAYALMHFSEEENLMAEAGFPGLAAHRREHEKLMERLQTPLNLYELDPHRTALDIVDLLETWMHEHIAQFDVPYGRFLRDEI